MVNLEEATTEITSVQITFLIDFNSKKHLSIGHFTRKVEFFYNCRGISRNYLKKRTIFVNSAFVVIGLGLKAWHIVTKQLKIKKVTNLFFQARG